MRSGLWHAATAIQKSAAFKSSFVKNAESYFGATGWTVLNAAGDRKYGNYDFWAVTETDETYSWEMVATYLFDPAGTGDLVRY